MAKIRPHLWFETAAVQAAELYVSVFDDSRVTNVSTMHDTPSGDVDVVSFEILGQPVQAISAGPLFKFTPAISLLIRCTDAEQVDDYFAKLSGGGRELMPLDEYPFSKRYAWIEDRYGFSWQFMLDDSQVEQAVVPKLMFVGDVCGKAEEAMKFYTEVFPDSGLGDMMRYDGTEGPDPAGTIKHGMFKLFGQTFSAMDSAWEHNFGFNEAVSLMVSCDTQQEIDAYWSALSAVPEAEQCGWLKDRYGVSWQVVPSVLDEMLSTGTPEQVARVTQAFLSMKKFVIADLERARVG